MIVRFCGCLAVILCLAGCGGAGDGGGDKRPVEDTVPVVVAVNYPVAFMAEQIAGDWLEVKMPVPGNVDPAYWQPTVDQVVSVQQATLILLNGAGYAGWIEKVSLPEEKLIDTSAQFSDQFLPLESALTHTHGLSGEHAHAGYAFTTWMDLGQATRQAAAIRDALVGLLPEREVELTANFTALEEKFERLDQRWRKIGAGLAAEGVLFSHPVYQYWQRRYSVAGTSLHWEPDIVPEIRQWQALDELIAEHSARWMIWEAEPLPEIRAGLAERGVEILVLPPVATRPASGDLMTILADATSLLEDQM